MAAGGCNELRPYHGIEISESTTGMATGDVKIPQEQPGHEGCRSVRDPPGLLQTKGPSSLGVNATYVKCPLRDGTKSREDMRPA